jgi:hypothetical protein
MTLQHGRLVLRGTALREITPQEEAKDAAE